MRNVQIFPISPMPCTENLKVNKSTACGCQRSAAAAFRKFLVEKGANHDTKMRITFLTGMGSPLDSKQLA